MQPSQHTVLITGGASGIGRALAARFLQEGNRVIVTGRDAAKLAAAQEKLPGLTTMRADMTDAAALDRLAAAFPDVSVLVHKALSQHSCHQPH